MGMHKSLKKFETIYNETYDEMIKFVIYKCSDLDDINDIVQDVYFEFYKALENNVNIENYKSYLFGIAKNKVKKYYDIKSKTSTISIFQKMTDDESVIQIASEIDVEADFINKDNIEKIWTYLKQGNIVWAKIFYLYFVQENTLKEIATMMDMKESTVKSNLYRTIKLLKKIFGGEKQKL